MPKTEIRRRLHPRAIGLSVVLLAIVVAACSLLAPNLPPLQHSVPAEGDMGFPISGWIVLDFAEPVDDRAIERIELSCENTEQPIRVHRVTTARLAVDPIGELSAASTCMLSLGSSAEAERIRFTTGVSIPTAQIPYDREKLRQMAPYPDDYWLAENPSNPNERRLRVQTAGFSRTARWLMNALTSGVREFDGFSPVAHITIPLTAPAEPTTIPQSPEASLDPLSSIRLIDVTPDSPDYGARVPFRLDAQSELARGRNEYAWLIFPSVALKAGHRYGLIVTRRALSHTGSPYDPSDFFASVRDGSAVLGQSWGVLRARSLVDEVLRAAASDPIAIERADVAFAVRFTIRSLDGIGDDLAEIRRVTASEPPPTIKVDRVEAGSSNTVDEDPVAVVVHGTWTVSTWRDSDRWIARNPASGAPVRTGLQTLRFTLALPRAAIDGPVPVVMYQHGNPGSAPAEVVEIARDSLAAAGFAVVGFTDVINREVSPPGPSVDERARLQVVHFLLRLMATSKFPDDYLLTIAEQFGFLRAIQSIAAIPSFSIESSSGAQPKRIHGIDPTLPVSYLGVSEGAHLGSLLLPFAPEIHAAALISPGRRFGEILVHQGSDRLRTPMAFLGVSRMGPTDAWVALALIQQLFDDQDPHNFARFLYREPLEIGVPERASLLVVEGLNDSLVPNHATRAWVREVGGLGLLGGTGRAIYGLDRAEGPVSGNVDARTSAAFYQYVPRGVEGIDPTPGCNDPELAESSAREGHYCAQSAQESLEQRVHFFRSALEKRAPEIIDPLTQ
jgi:hypothetical protein